LVHDRKALAMTGDLSSTGDFSWQAEAACRDADQRLFFSTQEPDVRAALAYCARCTVRGICLQTAMSRRERFGVWGGTRERERRRIFRERSRRRSDDAA
jgi:WhiB family transcriptional regulator, redox-sensing transcriptional regulator